MYLNFYDSSLNLLSSTGKASTSGNWLHLAETVMAPTNAAYAEILCYVEGGSATGSVYFDNASLVYADEILANGDWEGAQAGSLPPNWLQINAGNHASIEEYESELVMKIDDQSVSLSQGAYLILPAFPEVPYKLSSLANKISGTTTMWLSFLDADMDVIENHTQIIETTSWDTYEETRIAPSLTAYIEPVPFEQ